MSKKKKNSNYKGTPDTKGSPTKKNGGKQETSPKTNTKTWIIIAACAAMVLGLVVGIISTTLANRSVYVEMDFGEYGTILIEVDKSAAPKTAKNFISLVKSGFYDGLTIYRAQKNFVIQGGENKDADLKTIYGEFDSNGHKNPISHQRGVISMARSNDPDSATSIFFITLHNDAAKDLDGKYASFGHVVEGMEVVDAIAGDLFEHSQDNMGFVKDEHAIKIVSARIVKK